MEFAQRSWFTCEKCQERFSSRNRLFRHIKEQCGSDNRDSKDAAAAKEKVAQVNDFQYNDWHIVVVGGRLRGRTLASVEHFDFSSRQWADCNRMAEHRGSHTATEYRGEVFVFGGGGFRSNLSSCEKFSLRTGRWSNIAPMGTLRHAHSSVRLGHRIFVVGGWINGSLCIADVEAYDCRCNSWETLAPMRLARKLHATASVGGRVYAFGGNAANRNHLCYNPASTSTTVTAAADSTDGNAVTDCAQEDDDDNHGHSSESASWYTARAEVYDCTANTWTDITPLPHPGPASAVGIPTASQGSGGGSDSVLVFMHGHNVVRYDPAANAYTHLSPLPLKEWYCFDVCCTLDCEAEGGGGSTSNGSGTASAGPWDGRVYLVGGSVNGVWNRTVWAYVVAADAWEELTSGGMRLPRRRCAAVMVRSPAAPCEPQARTAKSASAAEK